MILEKANKKTWEYSTKNSAGTTVSLNFAFVLDEFCDENMRLFLELLVTAEKDLRMEVKTQ
jgi:hypothetical protein